MQKIISPSLLSADFLHLADDIKMLNESQADWYHLDIMDGVFVPNISYGIPVVQAINKMATKPLDVHLMIVEPDRYFEKFKEAGAEIITFHYEASTHLHRSVQKLKSMDVKAGVVLNPHTPVSVLEDILGDLDLVLLMSVNPGFGGQKFMADQLEKVKALRKELDRIGRPDCHIQVDGGLGAGNVAQAIAAGANVIVAGTSVFRHPGGASAAIAELKA